ncbi:DUF2970 domain-containing protein [Flocculibacter collagenilyticus]|uniref:DUF2970 domain-containing protein n=1 Tax=Flocculibacter collagenilyticus TaxID=2744479 RepID=UPI0018F2B895|nr:DUF2970 domain-containing protein [Flocculibacter collagenilyticus]
MNASKEKSPTFFQIVLSVMAAFFGVQSKQNYQQDFNQGNPLPYIVVGIVMVILFVLTLVAIVSVVIN